MLNPHKFLSILLIFCCVSIYAEKLENLPFSLTTKGANIDELSYDKTNILRNIGLLLKTKNSATWFKSGPNESSLASIKDLWFIGFRGEMKIKSTPVLEYAGDAKFLKGKEFTYEVNGEFKDDFEGDFALVGSLDWDLIKGCGYEYYRNGKWGKGVVSATATKERIAGFSILKVFTTKGFALVIEEKSGSINLNRWESKRKDQPFRLGVTNTGKKLFQKGDKFNYSFTIKILSSEQSHKQTDNRNPVEMAYYSPKSLTDQTNPTITLDLKKLSGVIDFKNLTNIEVHDDAGTQLQAQVEDRNLNNKIDPFDLIVFKGTNLQEQWNGVIIKPVYDTERKSPLHVKLPSKNFIGKSMIFGQTGPNNYIGGFKDAGVVDISSRLPWGMPAVINDQVKLPPAGIYMTRGPVRTRISVIFLAPKKLPAIQSFIFDTNKKSITSCCAIFAFTGWGRYYLTVRSPEEFATMSPLVAYAYGNVKFLSSENKNLTAVGEYGNLLSGFYMPDNYNGVTLGAINEPQEETGWMASTNASVKDKKLSIFYPVIASSFINKAQISFINSKSGYTQALERCKNHFEWTICSGKAANKKLEVFRLLAKNIAEQKTKLAKEIETTEGNGIYMAAAKTYCQSVGSWLTAAQEHLEKGNITRFCETVEEAQNILKKAAAICAKAKSAKISLPLPPVKNEFMVGTCMGGGRKWEQVDFTSRFLDAACYAPLKNVGLRNTEFHSFHWGTPVEIAETWLKKMNEIDLNAFPQMSLTYHCPEEFLKKYPYYEYLHKKKKRSYFSMYSPKYMKGFRETDQMTKELETYFSDWTRRLVQAGDVKGFFAINEPTPFAFKYEGKTKDSFLYGMRNYLKEKYASIEKLNNAWNSEFANFSSITWDNKWLKEKRNASSTKDISGEWLFKEDPTNIGIKENWFSTPPKDLRKIKVPGLWEKEIPELIKYDGIAWYFKSLDLPDGDWKITFKAIDDNAEVYCNGKKIGENQGHNIPFNVIAQGGGNTLLAIRVEDTKGAGGIKKPVFLSSETNELPYYSDLRYPARCEDYYTYRNRVVADFATLHSGAMAKGAPGHMVAVKEWTSCLNYTTLTLKCDPFFFGPVNHHYAGWDQYNTDDRFFAYQTTLRQSVNADKPSVLGEYGLYGSGGKPYGTASIQKPIVKSLRFLGRNLRGIFFFKYSNNHPTAILNRDYSITRRLLKMGELARLLENLKGVFDSLLPKAEIGLYFSRNDAYMAAENMTFVKLKNLFDTFFSLNQNVVFVDSITLPSRMKQLKLLIIPSSPFISEKEWEMIESFRKNGGQTLVYSDTGIMNSNNTIRAKQLLPGVSYNNKTTSLKVKGQQLPQNDFFKMEISSGENILLSSDSNKPLVAEVKKNLFATSIDLGAAAKSNNERIRHCALTVFGKLLEHCKIPIYVKTSIKDREVQYLLNQNGDVFIFISPGTEKLTQGTISVNTQTLAKWTDKNIVYDYLNLKEAEVKINNSWLNLNIKDFDKDEQAIWRIGEWKPKKGLE